MNQENFFDVAKEISCRVTRTLLSYVREQNSGELGDLLVGLPLDEAYLSDTNNWVSHGFLQVLYQRMIDLLGDENAVYYMALASGRFHSLGILDRIVQLLGNPRLIYSQAPRYNRFLKLNGSVFIHEIGNSWVVLEDRYHDSSQKTRYDCDYTRGVLAGIPTMFGLPLAEVKEIKCQVSHDTYGRRFWQDNPDQGCAGCFYQVRWTPKKNPFWKRLFHIQNDHHQAIEDLVKANRLIQSKYDDVRRLMDDLEKTNRQLVVSKEALEFQKAELIESERKYRALAETVSDTIWIIDLNTLKFTYISPSVEKNRGFTVDEAMAQGLDQTLSSRSLAQVTEILEKELADDAKTGIDPQRSRRIEIEQSIKGGGYAWAETIVTFRRNRNGVPTAIMGVTRDIAERKRAERKIAESEKKYRNLFENGSDIICIHDLDGNILETNLPYKEEYGLQGKDLVGVNIRELIPKHHKARFNAYLDRIIANGEDEGYLKAFIRSGRAVILEYRNKLIFDHNGTPKAVQGAGRDVSQRLEYEKALKESEEKYKNIVRYAPAGIYEFDMETLRFASVNDVMCEYTGYSQGEFLELDPVEIIAEESRETFNALIQEVFTKKPRALAFEYKIVGKNRKEMWVLSNSRFFYEDGVPKRAMAVVHDLTEIRKAQEEKRVLEVKLQNARKLESLGTLAGGVAHDLNNILSGIVSYPDLLLHNLDANSPFREPLETIKKSGQKAATIVQDLLTLARRGVSSKQVVNLNHIVRDFLVSPEYRKIVEDRHNIRVRHNLSENMLNLMGSEAHLSKTVMNLVANALDAMPAGGTVTISTRDCYLDKTYDGFETIPQGEYTVVEVSDMGIGMPPSDLHNIFEPFYTKKVLGRSGTGLGMSVVWGTVRDHDGFIDIITEEGAGTTFVLYFPATRSELDIPSSIRMEEYLAKGESILIIDDSEEQRDLAQRMMERLGYRVFKAESGEAAVAMIKKRPYDLLVLDMIMPPGMDGLETYRQILKTVPTQKAVIASGFAKNESVLEAQQLGVGGYIRKPYTLEAIGIAARKELDRVKAG